MRMDKIVKFKASYLQKLIWGLIIIGVVFSLVVFLGFDVDIFYGYFLSVMVVFIGVLLVFYFNRYDVEELRLNEENVDLVFFNKVFFKKESKSYKKQDLNTKKSDSLIELNHKNSLVARIRKDSVKDQKEWEEISSYLSS